MEISFRGAVAPGRSNLHNRGPLSLEISTVNQEPIRVVVTGAAGQIGYALLPRIASGQMFGPQQPLVLQLIELPIEKAMDALQGVAMELEDCAFPLLQDLITTSDLDVGFKDADWALLVGSKPRGAGMERNDLIKENGPIFVGQGKAINDNAARDCRTVVVGNPCNTNCLIGRGHSWPAKPELWSGCIAGAFQESAFLSAFAQAGFSKVEILERSDSPWREIDGIAFRSLTVRAQKEIEAPNSTPSSASLKIIQPSPAQDDSCCEPGSCC